MIILLCGSRYASPTRVAELARPYLNKGDTLIHGDAPGADQAAKILGEELDITVIPFPAEWAKYGKAAGPIRNKKMLTEGKPDLILAYPIGESKGTRNMMDQGKDIKTINLKDTK